MLILLLSLLLLLFCYWQVRDEYRVDYDPGRGGYGKKAVEQHGVVTGAPVAYKR